MAEKILISVLAPCLNEEANIPALAERVFNALSPLNKPFELVLVDDGSTDATYETAARLGEARPWLKIVRHDVNKGMAEGWASALAASRGGLVVTIDADMQYRPEDIPALYKKLVESGADIAQGWRESNPGGNKTRRAMSAAFSSALNVLFGMKLRDVKSGFLMCRREIFDDILKDRARFKYFQHFPTIAANAMGYSIVEVPVVFEARRAGQSFIKNTALFGLKALVDMPTALKLYGGKHR